MLFSSIFKILLSSYYVFLLFFFRSKNSASGCKRLDSSLELWDSSADKTHGALLPVAWLETVKKGDFE